MNTKIAKALLGTPANVMDEQAKNIVEAHNDAVTYGFIEQIPYLTFCSTYCTDTDISVTVQPRIDSVDINDLYLLKQAWGASDLYVRAEGIELVFYKS